MKRLQTPRQSTATAPQTLPFGVESVHREEPGQAKTRITAPDLDLLDETVKDHPCTMVMARGVAIMNALGQTCIRNADPLERAVEQTAQWFRTGDPVRMLGAGRARAAMEMAAHRFAQVGVAVSLMNGQLPPHSTIFSGGAIAASASGETEEVKNAMEILKRDNPAITILGLARDGAEEFKSRCDIFIGLHIPKIYGNPVSALADTEESLISLLLDALVVLAGRRLGFDDAAWRWLHERIGATGPYGPTTQLPPALLALLRLRSMKEVDEAAVGLCFIEELRKRGSGVTPDILDALSRALTRYRDSLAA